MKTACVLGSAGFIGRHMMTALTASGYGVQGIDTIYPRDHNGWHTLRDARDYLRSDTPRFDVVVHAAAVGADRASIDESPLALAANLELDAALFQWAARTRPGRVVYLSSSAAYDVRLQRAGYQIPLGEDFISLESGTGPPDGIYGWIKLTGERLAAHARDAGVPVTVARPFSGYGEDQDPARFPFAAILARAQRREDPFAIWGTGMQVRDFIHVDDICAAVLVMIERGIDGPVNLGTGVPTSMLELARMACREAGYGPRITPLPGKPSGVAYRVADTRRLREFYEPRVSLEEGVRRALARQGARVG